MATIEQSRPVYFGELTNFLGEFTTAEELTNTPFVKLFASQDGFDGFYLSRDMWLIASYYKGTQWWVVGRVTCNVGDKINLPLWHGGK